MSTNNRVVAYMFSRDLKRLPVFKTSAIILTFKVCFYTSCELITWRLLYERLEISYVRRPNPIIDWILII